MKGQELIKNTDLTLMTYCGDFFIKEIGIEEIVEGGANNYKCDLPIPSV